MLNQPYQILPRKQFNLDYPEATMTAMTATAATAWDVRDSFPSAARGARLTACRVLSGMIWVCCVFSGAGAVAQACNAVSYREWAD